MDAVQAVDTKANSIRQVLSVPDVADALARASDDEKEMIRALVAHPRSEILLWGERGMAVLLVGEETARMVVCQAPEENMDLPTVLQLWSEARGVTILPNEGYRIQALTVDDLPLCYPFGYGYLRDVSGPGAFNPQFFTQSWLGFYEAGMGHLVGFWHGERLVGVVGGIVYPDSNTGVRVAQVLLRSTLPPHRAEHWEAQMVRSFDRWARACGAANATL